MKAYHKLLTGILMVALAGFGLTALTSSSTNSGDTRVWGWLNTTCNSEWSMIFQSIGDMLEFSGTVQYGVTWDFKSYYRAAEVDDTGNFGQCHLVSDFDPEIVVRGTPIPWTPVGGGGGGGSQRPGEPGVEGGPEVENPPPPKTEADKLTEEEFQKLKECWEKTAEARSDLDGWSDDDTSSAVWRVVRGEHGAYGWTEATATRTTTSKGEEETSIAIGVSIFTDDVAENKRFKFNHLLTYAQIHEKIHVFQILTEYNDGDRQLVPEPYEWYWLEVQTHNRVYEWWPKLFPFKN